MGETAVGDELKKFSTFGGLGGVVGESMTHFFSFRPTSTPHARTYLDMNENLNAVVSVVYPLLFQHSFHM